MKLFHADKLKEIIHALENIEGIQHQIQQFADSERDVIIVMRIVLKKGKTSA